MAKKAKRRRSTSPRGGDKLGFSIAEKVAEGPLGRSMIYEAIADGRLVAHKAGRRTIILEPDWQDFLRALPNARPAAPLMSDDDPADRRDRPIA